MPEVRAGAQQHHRQSGSSLVRHKRKVQPETQEQQQRLVIRVQTEMDAKMEGGSSSSSKREANPLLSAKQKARSAVLLSIQSDIGKGIVYNIRLSRWYLAYCSIMAIATLSLVIFMIVDVHFVSRTHKKRLGFRVYSDGPRPSPAFCLYFNGRRRPLRATCTHTH